MAGSVNKVIIVGNLGKDAEVRNTQGGNQVANLRIATSERWKDKTSGEWQEQTEWHTVVMWGQLAEVAGRYAVKGAKVYVEGQLKTRKWKDKDGNDRYSTEIEVPRFGGAFVLLDKIAGKGDGQDRDDAPGSGRASGGAAAQRKEAYAEDDVPF